MLADGKGMRSTVGRKVGALLLFALLLYSCEGGKPKGASLTLKARFNSTSYLLEAAEFLADEDASLVWSYLDRLVGSPGVADGAGSGDEVCWRTVTGTVAELVTPGVAKLIPLVLGSRQYAAKLQMVRQLTAQFHPDQASCCFVSVGGRVATNPRDLEDLLKRKPTSPPAGVEQQPEQLFPFDHVYRPGGAAAAASSDKPRHVAVLYGSPGLACFAPFYRPLVKAAQADPSGLTVAFRPLLQPQCEAASGCARVGTGSPLLLPGWGVEAALKNTEYSAMDDKEAKKQQQAVSGGAGGDTDTSVFGEGEAAVVKGFRLDVLAARRPDLRQELLTFRDQLLAADDDEAEVKVWDLRDVGLQATQRILGSADPLGLLAELSQNFPGIVASLSRQPVNASLRSAVGHNQQLISVGANFLLLNGLAVDVNDFDYYAFLGRLRHELRLRDSLVATPLGLSAGLAQQVLALRAEEGTGAAGGTEGQEGAEPRLSLGPTSTLVKHVAFLNDLESDSKYQRFPHSISELLNTFPGRLRPLARNVFTSVVVVQPLCASSLELATAIQRMWQGGYPIRFGVVFHLPSVVARVVQQRRYPFLNSGGAPAWAEMDGSERFGRAFATLREAFGPAAAWNLWSTAAEEVTSGDVTDPAALVEAAFTSAWAAAARVSPSGARAKAAARKSPEAALKMLRQGEGYAAEAGMQLAETATWLHARGLIQPPALSDTPRLASAGVEDAESCEEPPVTWLNGLVSRPSGSAAEDMMYKVMSEMQRLQEMVYFGRLSDSSSGGDVLAAVLQLNGAVERLNSRIVGPKARNAQVLPLVPLLDHKARFTLAPLYRDPANPASKPKAAGTMGGHTDAEPRVAPVTHFVVTDLSSEEGRGLLTQAVRFLAHLATSSATRDARLVLLVNPTDPAGLPTLLEAVVQGALGEAGKHREKVIDFLDRLLSDVALVSRLSGDFAEGSAEEAQVAVKFAEQAGLEGSRLMGYLVRLVDETLQNDGTVKGGTASLKYRAVQADLCRTVFKLAPGASAVVSNGRVTEVVRPGGELQELLAEDLVLLQMVAGGGGAAAVARTVKKAHQEGSKLPASPPNADISSALSDVTAVLAATLAVAARSAPSSPGGSSARRGPSMSQQLQNVMGQLKGQALQVSGGPDAPFHLEAIINPLSRPAQRLSAVLLLLREALGPSMSLTLNPQREITQMPLKSYYRYALPQGLSSGASDAQLPGDPVSYFARLPSRRVLTLNMDVPEVWLVEPAAALYDLDNLRLADVKGEVAFAEFELDALMLTGSCVDVTASNRMTPPRGLQLLLGTPFQPHKVDTLVMANLAYFQLKAAPGRWILSLAPGRSRELYSLVSSTGASLDELADEEEEQPMDSPAPLAGSPGDSEVSTQVLISSFTGKHMILRVRKRPGMEDQDVLLAAGEEGEGPEHGNNEYDPAAEDLEDDEYDDEDEKPQTLVGRVSALLSGNKKKEVAAAPRRKPGGDVINVFTVASGHMYERLQKIMILSVLRHTKSRVKFWIIKNYMSPQHKEVVPALAEKFGFDYEFVTYKWPHWLHKQTDKQRLIWAYKILFLDVLFPLGLERIIFVDSDQVVRSDLADLYHMDIKGAPYAYTPFCDNNKEMDEYRFWKGGFWKDHLMGKPYHISALYLVDLKRFRQIAAGDQLRVVYDQLSKDPNSLANLDQDLPNYAQHNIKIFSLPQEWLWCESWCGNATKARAKTIDLCNNPKTKEPKLTAARRIIGPLWEELDRQQGEVTRTVQDKMAATEAGLPEGEVAGQGQGPEAAAELPMSDAESGPPSGSDHTEL